jgi:CheY-like chemotaxis protein
LEHGKGEQPYLIIADIGMAQEEGCESVQKLRALEHEHFQKRISAIVLTA